MHRGAFRATAQSAAKDTSSAQRTHMCDITLYTHYRSFTHMCDITYYTRITAALPTCVTSHIIHALPQLYPHV